MNKWDDNGRSDHPSKEFIYGGEESYGYLLGKHTRDKDAVVACCAIAEMALGLTVTKDFNRYFISRNDVWNANLLASVRWRLR